VSNGNSRIQTLASRVAAIYDYGNAQAQDLWSRLRAIFRAGDARVRATKDRLQASYGYGNARVRAMKSRLLTAKDFQALLDREDATGMISYLAQTDYKPDVDAALARYEGLRCLEEALRLHLVRIMRRVHSFYEGEPHRLLGAALSRWDVFNIKTVLRAQQVQVPPDRILSLLFPIGELDDVALGEMVRQPGVKESVDWLVTWGSPYGWPLAAAMPEYAETGNLTVLERALERFQVTRLQTALPTNGFSMNLVREMLGLEIDVTNLVTILRTRGGPEPEQVRDYLLDGGQWLHRRHLEALIQAPDVAGVLAALEDVPYQDRARQYVEPLRQAWPRYEARHDLAVLEMALERYVIEQGIKQLRQDPLSVAIPIGYVWAKTNEVANLRQVANGLAVELPRSAIEANLFLVS
jgi:V/A-type H+-transporting ATPase subunit C